MSYFFHTTLVSLSLIEFGLIHTHLHQTFRFSTQTRRTGLRLEDIGEDEGDVGQSYFCHFGLA
jgi:hypothetical protein